MKSQIEKLEAKYLKKKRTTKERKIALKQDIATLKRQLADALQRACTMSDEVT